MDACVHLRDTLPRAPHPRRTLEANIFFPYAAPKAGLLMVEIRHR